MKAFASFLLMAALNAGCSPAPVPLGAASGTPSISARLDAAALAARAPAPLPPPAAAHATWSEPIRVLGNQALCAIRDDSRAAAGRMPALPPRDSATG